MAATKVFIAGSRAVTRLNDAIRHRLDRVMREGHDVVIGDANGADRAVQQYLADHHYLQVTVFCTGSRCRNNVGGWTTRTIAPPPGVRAGFDFYAVKDREMASAATHGLMLWDGESRGTLTNIKNLLAARKPVVVYLRPSASFTTVRHIEDLDRLLDKVSAREEASREVAQ